MWYLAILLIMAPVTTAFLSSALILMLLLCQVVVAFSRVF